MERTLENVRSNFNSIRTGRSNPAMLDKIEVCLQLLLMQCLKHFDFVIFTANNMNSFILMIPDGGLVGSKRNNSCHWQ